MPDFLIFDEDLNRRNRAHCHYLIGLSKLGLGKREEAKAEFEQALEWDRNHQNALLYKKMTCDDIQVKN